MNDFERWYWANARAVGHYVNPLQGRVAEATQGQLNAVAAQFEGLAHAPASEERLRYMGWKPSTWEPKPKRLCGICELAFSRWDYATDDRCADCFDQLQEPLAWQWEHNRKILANRQSWWLRLLRWFASL